MAAKGILVPIDFSTVSLNALEYAIDFAKPFDADLVILFVIEPVYYATPADLYGPSANIGMLMEEQQRLGKEQLARLSAQLTKRKVRHRTVMQTGSAHDAIVGAAKRVKADLIIMATHGRTGLTRMLIGSTAERVVRTSPVPVLTLHKYRHPRRRAARAAKKRS
jgi:universal stress protein A